MKFQEQVPTLEELFGGQRWDDAIAMATTPSLVTLETPGSIPRSRQR
jgi:hypothetical protein